MAFLYELPTGKTIVLSTLQQLLDIDVQKEIANDKGEFITNPFFDIKEEDVFISIDIPDISNIESLPEDYYEDE